jgi:hypothetical protein
MGLLDDLPIRAGNLVGCDRFGRPAGSYIVDAVHQHNPLYAGLAQYVAIEARYGAGPGAQGQDTVAADSHVPDRDIRRLLARGESRCQ